MEKLPAIPKVNKTLSNVQILIIYFFIYSVLGWIFETFYGLLALGYIPNRGFLFGPLCPIYRI